MYAIIRRNTIKKESSATIPVTEGNIKDTSIIMTWGRKQQQKPANISSTAVANTTQRSRTPKAGRRQHQHVCLGNGREASNRSENGAQTKHIGMKRIGMKPIATKPIDLKGIGYKTYRNYRYRYIKHIAGLNISFTKPIGVIGIAILNISLY